MNKSDRPRKWHKECLKCSPTEMPSNSRKEAILLRRNFVYGIIGMTMEQLTPVL